MAEPGWMATQGARVAALPGIWRARVGWGLVVAALVVVGLRSQGLGLLSTLTTVFMYVVLAQGWNLLGGYAGYLNLGMAVFFGLGAYTTAILHYHYGMAPLAGVPAAALVACLGAAAVGIPTLRVRGSYFAILTMILGFLAQVLALNARITRGALGIYLSTLPWDRRTVEQAFYFMFLALAVAATWLVARVESSRFGYALVAVREDEDAAQVLGVRTTQVKMAALLLGALLAGAAGGVYAQRIGYLEPAGTFSLDISIDVVLMTLVGGAGTWQGPVIGVPLVMLLAESLRVGVAQLALFGSRVPNEFNRVVLGVVLILIALYARHGVMGLVRPVRGRRLTV